MTSERDSAIPDFLRIDPSNGGDATSDGSTWYGWPTKPLAPTQTQTDDQGRVTRVRTPVDALEGLITPTELFYSVQHFDVPEPVASADWKLSISGQVKNPIEITFDELQRFPGRTVRTVMECSGSDTLFFEYFKGNIPRPSRVKDGMIASAGEFTGVPLAAVLNEASLNPKAVSIRAEGWDKGIPATAEPGTDPFFYDKALPLAKALHPDTLIVWAQNGKLLEHLHGAPVRLIVPGWSGNWSVKWLRNLEVLDNPGNPWYHYSFYYFGDSPDDPNKELITAIDVKSMVTYPQDDDSVLSPGTHVVRGLAWSGHGTVSQVEVSVDGGDTWQAARIEEPRDRWMWARWSFVWDAHTHGTYSVMSRAADEAGNVQSREPRWNKMSKNFTAIVANDVTIK